MQHGTDRPLDVRHYGRMLWRRRGIILLCAVGVVCASLISLSFVPPTYQSEVTLLIEDREPLAAQLEEVIGGWRTPSPGGFKVEEQRLSRMIGRIRSRPFLERVIKILKMDEDPNVLEAARERRKSHPELSEQELAIRVLTQALQNRIQFGNAGPGLYKILVMDNKAENAQLLAKWVSELFVDVSIQKELEHIQTARRFGEEQLRVYEEQLERSEDALERYQGSILQQGFAAGVVSRENLPAAETLQRRMEDESATATARVAPLARAAEAAGMPAGDPRVKDDPGVQAMARRLTQALGSAAQDVLATTGANLAAWPPKGQVDVLRRDLYREIETRVQGLYHGRSPEAVRAISGYVFAQVDAGALDDAAAGIRQSIDTFKRRVQTGPVDEMELSRLEEDVKKNRELLQSFRAQLVASDVSQAVETTNLGLRMEIIDPAQTPLTPVRPNKSRILLAAIMIGPIVGVAFAFMSELLDPTLRNLDDIKRVAPEPVFGVLPRLSALRAHRSGWRKYWVPVTLGGLVLLTALFFVVRSTVLRDVAVVGQPVRMVDPGEGVSP